MVTKELTKKSDAAEAALELRGPNGDSIGPGAIPQRVVIVSGAIGAAALLAAVGLGAAAGDGFQRFLFSYLVAFLFVLSIALGALFWVTLQHLVNAKWSVAVRRVGEHLAAAMPLMALMSLPLVVPLLLGSSAVFPWGDQEAMHADHVLHHKAAYLNPVFFGARWLVYFAFWSGLAWYLRRASLRLDETRSETLVAKVRAIAAPSMIAFGVTLTFAAIDFIMSLDPMWFSTIFGVYYFAGCVLAFHGTMVLVLQYLQRQGRLTNSVTKHHFHDLGKMLFAFTVFWAYIGFSQFMLIWYANIPEETVWFQPRMNGPWAPLSIALIFGHFFLPFFGLLSRHVKRHRAGLAFWACWLLVMHYLDLYWLVMPNLSSTTTTWNLLDLLTPIGLLGVFFAGVAFLAKGIPLLATGDPRLEKSLAFENV